MKKKKTADQLIEESEKKFKRTNITQVKKGTGKQKRDKQIKQSE